MKHDVTVLAHTVENQYPEDESIGLCNVKRIHMSNHYSFPLYVNIVYLINALQLNADVYHIQGFPVFFVGVMLKLLQKCVIYEVRDDYPSIMSVNIFKKNKKIKLFSIILEKLLRVIEGLGCKYIFKYTITSNNP